MGWVKSNNRMRWFGLVSVAMMMAPLATHCQGFAARQAKTRLAADNRNDNDNDNSIEQSIKFDRYSLSYGSPGLWRKLTSSVPRREFALQDVTLALNSDRIYLLVGASSSGKSTILNSILRANDDSNDPACTAGSVTVPPTTTPILLDDRTAVTENYGSSPKTVLDYWNGKSSSSSSSQETNVLESLAETVSLSLEARVADLTPSERYRLVLGGACLQSSIPPILLLDEWMDVETTEVVQKVLPALEGITNNLGGIVVSVTHKPHLYETTNSNSNRICKITLSAGKVLSVR